MATTGKNFLKLPATVGGASTVTVLALTPSQLSVLNSQTGAVVLDKVSVDYSGDANAKHIGFAITLAASTPVTIDLTATSTASTAAAGDASFATIKVIVFNNLSAQDVIVSPGASNGFLGPLGGTAPTFTVPASTVGICWQSAAGWTVDGTHKTLKFDPGGSAASIGVAVSGA